jgi:hypothetical protein
VVTEGWSGPQKWIGKHAKILKLPRGEAIEKVGRLVLFYSLNTLGLLG